MKASAISKRGRNRLPKRLVKKDNYRIALLGDFKENSLRGIQIIGRKIAKGFIRNGHDVLPFSYRQQMNSLSWLPGKKLSRAFTQKKTDMLCCDLLRDYQPDLVLLLAYRVMNHETIARLRDTLPDALFTGWYPDTLDAMNEHSLRTNRLLDAFMATGAGTHLAEIARQSGNIPAAFMPNPCDPDVEKPYPQSGRVADNIFFSGKVSHKSCPSDDLRESLLRILRNRYDLVIHGHDDTPPIYGLEYYRAISRAKIALSVNAVNDIRMYHSDRWINCLACGAFVLSSYVPDSELLCEDDKHLRYFHTESQCLDLIDYYLEREDERSEIAFAGMTHVHKAFHCQRIASDILDFLTTGTYDEPWRDIVYP